MKITGLRGEIGNTKDLKSLALWECIRVWPRAPKMIRGLKLSIKKLFEFLGYSVKKIYSEEVFHFPRDFFPAEINNDQKKIIRDVEKYSMSGRIRMSLLIKIIEHIYNKSIEGDIVECGVWRRKSVMCANIFKSFKIA